MAATRINKDTDKQLALRVSFFGLNAKVETYRLPVAVFTTRILFIVCTDANPKYEMLMKEKMIDKLVVLTDSNKRMTPPVCAAFANEDIILADLASSRDGQEIAELVYARILNIYA